MPIHAECKSYNDTIWACIDGSGWTGCWVSPPEVFPTFQALATLGWLVTCQVGKNKNICEQVKCLPVPGPQVPHDDDDDESSFEMNHLAEA